MKRYWITMLLVTGIIAMAGAKANVLQALSFDGLMVSEAAAAINTRPQKDKSDHKKVEKEFFEQRAIQAGKKISPDAYDKAKGQWNRLPRAVGRGGSVSMAEGVLSLSAVSGIMGSVWTPIGPSPINQGTNKVNGRVSAIAVNPNNSNLIYQGASGGGLWRTTDGGSTWTTLFDQMVSLAGC